MESASPFFGTGYAAYGGVYADLMLLYIHPLTTPYRLRIYATSPPQPLSCRVLRGDVTQKRHLKLAYAGHHQLRWGISEPILAN